MGSRVSLVQYLTDIFSCPSVWAAKQSSFLGASLGSIHRLPCFFEVVMLYLWLEKQENVSMVRGKFFLCTVYGE